MQLEVMAYGILNMSHTCSIALIQLTKLYLRTTAIVLKIREHTVYSAEFVLR